MIPALILLQIACSIAAPFELREIPLMSGHDEVFLAQTRPGKRPDILLLSDNVLELAGLEADAVPRKIALPSGTTAFDVGDIDMDDRFELIAIHSLAEAGGMAAVIRFSASGDRADDGQELFRFATQLADPRGHPYPHVMITDFEGARCIAVIADRTLDLRKPDGTIMHQFPIGADAPHRASVGLPFMAASTFPAQVAPWLEKPHGPFSVGPLECKVQTNLEFEPVLPAPLLSGERFPLPRRVMLRQMTDARGAEYSNWPWFPLQLGPIGTTKVLFAVGEDTVVRIAEQDTAFQSPAGSVAKAGSERRYPGRLVPSNDVPPDFNGDGYADLLLWKAADAGASIDSVARAVTSRMWPIRLTIHLYNPGKHRFNAVPQPHLTVPVPVGWFVEAEGEVPLKFMHVADFNGDGRTDVAFATSEKSYAVYLSNGDALSAHPDADWTFNAPLKRAAFVEDVKGDGTRVIGLLTETALCLVIPKD